MKNLIQSVFVFVMLLNIAQLAQSQESGMGTNKPLQRKPVFSAEQIAKKFLPGVALIVCEDAKGNISQGSGFFIAPGVVLTNAHVVKGMSRGVIITTANNTTKSKKFLVNTILYFNSQDTDLALLGSNEGRNEKATVLPLAEPNDVSIGETAYVLSNPEGLIGTISQGIVSSGIRQTGKMDLLQITAPISSGSSGGAVINSHGEVIGMATSTLSSGQNLNFAVPAAQISQFLNRYINDKSVKYSLADKIPNSWKVPETFILAQKEDSKAKNSPPISGKDLQPTLKETTDWLTDKVLGLKGYFYEHRMEYRNVSFKQCQINFDQIQYSPEGTAWKVTSYSANLKFADNVVIGPTDQKNPIVMINFNGKRVSEKESSYVDGELIPTQSFDDMTGGSSGIVFHTGDREESKRLEIAFNYTIKLCR